MSMDNFQIVLFPVFHFADWGWGLDKQTAIGSFAFLTFVLAQILSHIEVNHLQTMGAPP